MSKEELKDTLQLMVNSHSSYMGANIKRAGQHYKNYIDYKELITELFQKKSERAEYYELQSERKTYALEEIISALNEDYFENWEQAIEIAYEHKKDYVRGEKLSNDLKIRTTKERLIKQNKRYREFLNRIHDTDDIVEVYDIVDEYKILEESSYKSCNHNNVEGGYATVPRDV